MRFTREYRKADDEAGEGMRIASSEVGWKQDTCRARAKGREESYLGGRVGILEFGEGASNIWIGVSCDGISSDKVRDIRC